MVPWLGWAKGACTPSTCFRAQGGCSHTEGGCHAGIGSLVQGAHLSPSSYDRWRKTWRSLFLHHPLPPKGIFWQVWLFALNTPVCKHQLCFRPQIIKNQIENVTTLKKVKTCELKICWGLDHLKIRFLQLTRVYKAHVFTHTPKIFPSLHQALINERRRH